jgi:hypothetical protein
MRLRVLSALIACLAVVATGLPAVALAWAGSSVAGIDNPAAGHIVQGTLCTQHCPSCQDMPCPPTAERCAAACASLMPTLGVPTFTLSAPDRASVRWPTLRASLRGLSRPPDPFPPRA